MAALRYILSLLWIFISLIAAFIGILAFLAAYTSPEHSSIITYAGLAMPVILLINLFLAIYWLFRKSYWSLLPIASLILNIGYFSAIFQISFSNEKTPSPSSLLKIATYNVGRFHSWTKQETYFSITDYLKNDETNIVCFQEYIETRKTTADSICKLLNLPYFTVKYLDNSSNYGAAIFSKYPIIQSGKIHFESQTNDAIWADLQIDSQIIRVISCHLETTNFNRKMKEIGHQEFSSVYNQITTALYENSQKRAKQAKLVRAMIDTTSYPVIVCGDFNDPPSTYTYHHIKGNLKDSFRSKGKGFGYTFRGLHRLLRIDYILYSSQFECLNYNSEEQEWSDHNPIITELMLKH